MGIDGYTPSLEEIQRAENSMTPQQQELSVEREAQTKQRERWAEMGAEDFINRLYLKTKIGSTPESRRANLEDFRKELAKEEEGLQLKMRTLEIKKRRLEEALKSTKW